MIRVKRANEDGPRILVDRPWPRGVSKARAGTLTLVYAAADEGHNNAVALKAYLEQAEG